MQRARGISLIELLLVLALAAVLAFLGIRSLNQSRTNANMLALQENVARIFQAANEYYAEKCNASLGESFTLSWNDIAPLALLPTTLVDTESGNPYVLGATFYKYNQYEGGVKIPMYRFTVLVKLASHVQSPEWVAQRLQAQLVGADTLQWIKAPSYAIKDRGTQTWPMAGQLKRFKQEFAGSDLEKLGCGY